MEQTATNWLIYPMVSEIIQKEILTMGVDLRVFVCRLYKRQ